MGWEQAYRRAERIAGNGGEVISSQVWEWRAVCGVLAIALVALAEQRGEPAEMVPLDALPWHLMDQERVRVLAAEATAGGDEDAVAQWEWLTRRWPENPDGERWDGLYRFFLPDVDAPAIDIVVPRTLDVCLAALNHDRGSWRLGIEVKVVGGEHDGRSGRIMSSAWSIDGESLLVAPGPPAGYGVHLDHDGLGGPPAEAVVVPAGQLRALLPGLGNSPREFGTPAPGGTVWEAALAWSTLMVQWHLRAHPGDWTVGGDQTRRAPLVTALLAALILDSADGPEAEALRRVPLRPLLNRLPLDAPEALGPVLARVPAGAGETGLADLVELRELWDGPVGPTGRTRQADRREFILHLTRSVVIANVPVPRGLPPAEALAHFDQDTAATVASRARVWISPRL
ncbi:hypothetical protein ACFVXG_38470 [Kitasatospora sp. NPDC058162]|uniref:hypothetical protein n=1 Tax=Kitasatospora sp. NPDC058162 TaxID=3346362 RepID=UPI0036DE964F